MTRRPALLVALALALLGAGKRPAGLGDVVDIRMFDHASHTRVVIELSAETTFSTNTLSTPRRLYVDVEGIWIEEPFRAGLDGSASGTVRRVRGGQNTLTTARVVLELAEGAGSHRVFALQDPYRIVVDVSAGDAPAPTAPPVHDASFDERSVRRIVIDPGHGGRDPGAIGHAREETVVLAIGRALRDELRARGFEVEMTRDSDRFLTLTERTEYANRLDADLFVSVHANASPRRTTSGVETYLLDTRYDRQTARVAARENGTSVAELSDLQKILASLRLGYNERFAAKLAESVQASLVSRLRRHYEDTRDLGVKHGPFLVLFQADMPAILVEVGFVTNREEGQRLKSDAFARRAALGIAEGIVAYRDAHERSVVAGVRR